MLRFWYGGEYILDVSLSFLSTRIVSFVNKSNLLLSEKDEYLKLLPISFQSLSDLQHWLCYRPTDHQIKLLQENWISCRTECSFWLEANSISRQKSFSDATAWIIIFVDYTLDWHAFPHVSLKLRLGRPFRMRSTYQSTIVYQYLSSTSADARWWLAIRFYVRALWALLVFFCRPEKTWSEDSIAYVLTLTKPPHTARYIDFAWDKSWNWNTCTSFWRITDCVRR